MIKRCYVVICGNLAAIALFALVLLHMFIELLSNIQTRVLILYHKLIVIRYLIALWK